MVHRLRCLRRPRPNHDPSLSFEVSRSVTGEDWVRPVVSRRRVAVAAGTGRSISAGLYGRSAQEAAARRAVDAGGRRVDQATRLCPLSAAALWRYRPPPRARMRPHWQPTESEPSAPSSASSKCQQCCNVRLRQFAQDVARRAFSYRFDGPGSGPDDFPLRLW
jgi:hypothetical protein